LALRAKEREQVNVNRAQKRRKGRSGMYLAVVWQQLGEEAFLGCDEGLGQELEQQHWH
jgi:hypothetical protein